ncbi:MAG: lipoprotein [Hyphomonas sp.]|jgi:hypothetical protein|nr:lipoprotein [Hyphomonas sp.]
MKKFIFAAVAALALAGCGAVGSNPKTAMVTSCTESGESEANCTCIADSLEKGLDKETFKVVATAMAAGEAEGEQMINDLPVEKQGAVMGALMSAGMSCMMGAAAEG